MSNIAFGSASGRRLFRDDATGGSAVTETIRGAIESLVPHDAARLHVQSFNVLLLHKASASTFERKMAPGETLCGRVRGRRLHRALAEPPTLHACASSTPRRQSIRPRLGARLA